MGLDDTFRSVNLPAVFPAKLPYRRQLVAPVLLRLCHQFR
jgi:hypothetical protein